jgi:hypothetical protein
MATTTLSGNVNSRSLRPAAGRSARRTTRTTTKLRLGPNEIELHGRNAGFGFDADGADENGETNGRRVRTNSRWPNRRDLPTGRRLALQQTGKIDRLDSMPCANAADMAEPIVLEDDEFDLLNQLKVSYWIEVDAVDGSVADRLMRKRIIRYHAPMHCYVMREDVLQGVATIPDSTTDD